MKETVEERKLISLVYNTNPRFYMHSWGYIDDKQKLDRLNRALHRLVLLVASPLVHTVKYTDILDRLRICDIALTLYKTKRGYYKEWAELQRQFRVLLSNKLDLKEIKKRLKQTPTISRLLFEEMKDCCSVAKELYDNKSAWIKFEATIHEILRKNINDSVANIEKHHLAISRLKTEMASINENLDSIYRELEWQEPLVLQLVDGDGSCDECYYNGRNNCKSKTCKSGVLIYKEI